MNNNTIYSQNPNPKQLRSTLNIQDDYQLYVGRVAQVRNGVLERYDRSGASKAEYVLRLKSGKWANSKDRAEIVKANAGRMKVELKVTGMKEGRTVVDKRKFSQMVLQRSNTSLLSNI